MTRSVAVLVAAAGDIWQNAKVLIPNKSHTQEQEDVTALERYERARIIGARALQISLGAPVLIRPDTGDPIDIAMRELEEDVLPITVKR